MFHRLRAATTTAVVAVLALAIASTVFGTVSATRYTWRTEMIDSDGNAGRHSSLAIAANGTLYVLYHDADERILSLATLVADTWSLEVVAGPGTVVGDTNIALDVRGDLHLSFYDANSTYVRYGRRAASGGSWNITNVDVGYFEGYNRLALDPLGNPRIAYTTFSGRLRYAYLSGSVWVREDVDALAGAKYESLALDRFGNPQIGYYGNGQLRHASKPNQTWLVDVPDPRDYFGQYAQIGLDSAGTPRIAYYDEPDGRLWYVERTPTGWSRSVVDATGNPGLGISMVVGKDDRPRIAYYAQVLGELRYAERVNGTWEIQIADEDYTVGWDPSLALDPKGLPHIAYYDWTRGALRHAVGLSVLGARTAGASEITETESLLRGEVTSLDRYVAANVSFNWREVGKQPWQNTTPVSVATAGAFEARVYGLVRGTRYEFRAVAEAGGTTEMGRTLTFATPAPAPENPGPLLWIAAAITVAAVGLSLVMLAWFGRLSFKRRGDRRRGGLV